MSLYDYTCPDCTHEFDYIDGVKYFRDDKYLMCPHCRVDVTETVIDNEETYNTSE